MNKYIEEINSLFLCIEQPLEHNLYLLNKALMELKGKALNQNYDTIISILLIYYNYINLIKKDDPLFEAIIRLPDILNYESSINSNKYEIKFVSEQYKDLQHGRLLSYDQNDELVIQQIRKYLAEEVNEQVEIVEGKRVGKYQGTQIQSLKRVVLGGTFDHLHYGHKILLSAALLLAIPNNTEIVLGLTGSELLKNKKNKELLQSFQTRKNRIEYIQSVFAPQTKFFIFELMEPMGPLKDQEFEGVIISHETLQSSIGINKFRKENGHSELPLYVIDIINQGKGQSGSDFSEKASSTQVRNYLLEKNNLTCEHFGYLYEKWRSIFNNYNENSQLYDKWFDNIKLKYSEYPRHYHTLSHIYSMLQLAEQYKFNHSIEVQLAIWFHDVIYNPKRNDNEKRSADYYLEFDSELKKNNLQIGQSKVVESFILQTANHVNEDITEFIKNDQTLLSDQELFLDIDLSILGQSQEIYDKYSKDIIKEYSHLSKEQIKHGRTQILTKFLNEKNLFKTKLFQERFAEQTKINLEREISTLASF